MKAIDLTDLDLEPLTIGAIADTRDESGLTHGAGTVEDVDLVEDTVVWGT